MAELRPYEPTWRDRIAQMMMGDGRASPERRRFVEGLLGSSGLGNTGMGVVDVTPVGGLLQAQEAVREGDPRGAALAVLPIPGAAKVKQAANVAADVATPQGIRAYHGSPHDYPAERLVRYGDGRTEYLVGTPTALPDVPQGATLIKDFPNGRMRLDKIGTGEGAQAFGHGLYTAEGEGVARSYRDALATKPIDTVNNAIQAAAAFSGEKLDATKMRDWLIREGFPRENITPDIVDLSIRAARGQKADGAVTDDALLAYRALEPALGGGKGKMYEVNIRANPENFLDWDKPLSQQQHIQEVLPKMGFKPAKWPYSGWESQEGRLLTTDNVEDLLRAMGPKGSGEKALNQAGIPGIKYLDQGSRAAGEGSRNYVVFDENLIDILRKYGLVPGMIGGGAAANSFGLLGPEGSSEY